MAAPVTVTFTMRDTTPTTVALTIPSHLTASQFIAGIQHAGGLWDKPKQDTAAGATWWPWVMVSKIVTS